MRFPYYETMNYAGLVNAYTTTYGSVTNVRITGSGAINGGSAGSAATGLTTLGSAQASAKVDSARADLITIKGVSGFYLGGLTLTNPAMHTIFISYSKDVTVSGITSSTFGLHNADGIDLAVSDGAFIFDSTFDTGDDCINLNAGTSRPGEQEARPDDHIRIFNNLTKRGHGGVVFGSFTAGWIQNVWVEDCTFDGTDIGLRFKTGADRGGGARLVTARDIIMKNIVSQAILLDSTYTPGTYAAATTPGVFQQVVIQNVTSSGSGAEGIWVHGLAGKQHHDITMKNLSLARSTGASLDQMSTSTFDTIAFTGGGSWKRTNTAGLTFTDCTPSP
jgi:exo-poly-alpha-galacturonosidase